MGKPRDTKVAILPSTTRKGTTLSTSAALDSPSVISQLVSPPQTSRVGISAESENSSDNFDDASTVLDNTGSLGPFLDATIARSRQIENTETPNENTVTPVNSPKIDDLDEDYVELDDDFIDKCNATNSTSNLKKLIAQHAVRYKLSPDPKFATSPINIKDKDYDFSLDLSHISIVEKTPFCGTEKESAVEHMNELSTLSSLFSDDVKMRTYFVAKIFPFSLKDDAKIWKRTPDEAEELLAKISKNHDDWSTPEPTPTPIVKKRDPLYPEGHPKRIEQDSQRTKEISSPSKKKKKKHKAVVESSEPVNDPNSISISDAETESGNEHDEDNDKNDAPDKEEIEKEPEKHDKNKKYTKEDFITKKHGNEREPWVQKQMPFPAKKLKSKEEEHYNKFCDWMKPLFLQIPLTDAIKLPPYSKYMKDIVSNKRKIPNEEISTMLANYSFNGKVPKKLGDPGIPTIPCSIKNNYVRTALCDLGAGVSVMPFSLYKRLDLDKLIPTDISLQMADKSTAIPVGVCENVPVQVTQHCLILTDFVVLEMPEDDNMSIILGRPFLNTAGAVIDCNKGKVTFNVDDKEHTVYFPKRIDKVYGVNTIFNVKTIKVGSIDCPIYEPKEEYQTLVIGSISIQYKEQVVSSPSPAGATLRHRALAPAASTPPSSSGSGVVSSTPPSSPSSPRSDADLLTPPVSPSSPSSGDTPSTPPAAASSTASGASTSPSSTSPCSGAASSTASPSSDHSGDAAATPMGPVTRAPAGVFRPSTWYPSDVYACTAATAPSPPPAPSPRPASARAALRDPLWLAAMRDEFDALQRNKTWQLFPRPRHANVITGKWVFKHRFHPDGSFDRHKAHWVVRGFHPCFGVDFTDTFPPVVKPWTIRTVLQLTVSRRWHVHQMDVSNTFLHGHVEEQVFCQQPTGFVDSAHPDHVCLLSCSLYGLKQAPCARPDGFFLHKKKYAHELLDPAGMLNCSLVATINSLRYGWFSGPDASLYRSIISDLQYLTLTRPELQYDVLRFVA
ncbi:hypothetical protein QYE76_022743 [Lolium multiflorum]|uniref:Reverse transcriptase Ty1/copia-type domain-containing protein n=1 Tax=Lolium multiflorum TaxID=4521 RepID=A0AAD8VTH9_LOLMU|nr:hypothetical protein QYE76_022743 [Lolium multiflorum]